MLHSAHRENLWRRLEGERREEASRKVSRVVEKIDALATELSGLEMETNLAVLRRASVVGMTTSKSAMLQPLIGALKPKIIIAEEAGEVLEVGR